MYSTKSMVIQNVMEKVADYELPKDVAQWHQEILKQFFEKFQTLPPQYAVDLVMTNTDENRGYAKGSVVVGTNGKQINFPVVVRDYMLSPFDVFVSFVGKTQKYMPATPENIESELLSEDYGMPAVGPYSSYDESISLKRPGGIPAKVPVIQEDIAKFSSAPTWRAHILESDKAEFMKKLADHPELPANFEANTGSLLNEIVDLPTEKGSVARRDIQGKLDFSDVVKAKESVTVVDTMLFDPNKLVPIPTGHAAELRLNQFPSMEQFLELGNNAAIRGMVTDMGRPVSGIVVKVSKDLDNDDDDDRSMFISARGGEYIVGGHKMHRSDTLKSVGEVTNWSDSDVFYGSDLSSDPKVVEGIVNMLRQVKQNWMLSRINYDKGFLAQGDAGQSGTPAISLGSSRADLANKPNPEGGVIVLYKDGGVYKAYTTGGLYRMVMVNGAQVYINDRDSIALITTAVSKPTKVSSVNAPELIAVVGNRKAIVLIPSDAIVLNAVFMKELDRDSVLRPGKDIRMAFINAGIEATKVDVDEKQAGFRLSGPSVEPLFALTGLNKTSSLSPDEALAALQIVGCSRENAAIALQKTAEFAANGEPQTVTVFNTRGDYVDSSAFERQEKLAALPDILEKLANGLKRDMVKAASLIQDSDAVDTVLSLNFINRENLLAYVEAIPRIDSVIKDLAAMLVASRMGLQQVDEAAVKTAMQGLDEVLKGLIEIKTSLGE